jgi:hypothetical protein
MCRPVFLPLLLGALISVPVTASAQQPEDSTIDSVTIPPPPTPEQQRYLQGLRTAGRGVAQIKDGIDRVARAQSHGDTSEVRQAGHRLAGLCVAARGFIVSGRSRMGWNAYDVPTRKPARDLAFRLDSLAVDAKACQHEAGKAPDQTATGLLARVRDYEKALADFRAAIGLPNR